MAKIEAVPPTEPEYKLTVSKFELQIIRASINFRVTTQALDVGERHLSNELINTLRSVLDVHYESADVKGSPKREF